MRVFIASVGFCLLFLGSSTPSLWAQCSPDTENPVISGMPSNLTLSADAGQCGATATWTVPTATDNCALMSFVGTASPGDYFAVGNTLVTYTAMDQSGNLSASSFLISVSDDEDPSFEDVPTNLTQSADAGSCEASVVWTGPNAVDNCGISSTTSSHSSGDTFTVGITTVTVNTTDVNGRTASVNFTVEVTDDEDPTAIAQDLTVQLDASGAASITAAQADNGSNDACGIASLAVSQSNFDCSHVGANSVTLTATDNNGNTNSTTFTVTVEDNVNPTAICQNYTAQLDGNGAASITAADVNNGSSDACGIASMSLSQTDFTTADIGPNSVTLTVTDNNGNVSTCSSTVTVEDNSPPTAICQDLTIQLDASGAASITAAQVDNGSYDNSSIASMSLSQTDFNCTHVGTNSVTLTVTDDSGNDGTCTATITVEDNVNPTAIAQDLTVQLDASGAGTITGAQADNGSSDACGIASLVPSKTAYDCSDVGTPSTVTLTVTDNNGNIATTTFTVTVEDNVNPTAIAQNLTVQLDASGAGSITTAQADNGSNDACGIASLALSQTDFDCSHVGSNTVTLTATDNNGNTGTTTFTVTVEDNVNPTAIAQNLTVQLNGSGTGTITGAMADNGSSDACGIASLVPSKTAYGCSDVGTPSTVTLTVTDNNGNIATTTFTVTVEDNVSPTAICQNATVQLDASGAGSLTTGDVDNGSSDACGIASMSLNTTSFDCSNVGANTVTLTVTDNNGNVSTCNSTITVEDNVAPTAIAQNLTVQLDASGAGSITAAQADNGSNDACGIASLALSQTDFNCSHVGSNTVTLTATDNNGNTGTTTFTVTVQDNVNPTAIAQNLTVQLDASGAGTITGAQADNGSSDACGIASLVPSKTAYTCSDIGTPSTVTLTVTDNNGNVATTTFTVTVEDNVSPTATCQDLTVQLDASGAASITAAQVNNGSTDACGIASTSLSQTDFDCTHIGTNSVTLTVTDNNGNVSTCTSTITVEDNINPTAACQDLTIQLDASGNASITANDVDNGSSDSNCNVSLALSKTDFTCSDVGANSVTLTVTDDGNNVSTCTATITVEDNISPTAICQDLTVQLDANGTVSITANDVDNGSLDNCGIASLSLSKTDFTSADVGTNSVTLTVTDVNSNTSTCTATITVQDSTNPTAICQDLTVQLDANGAASITAAQVDNGSFDNTGIASMSLSQTDFTCADTGANSVTLTVTDDNGNTSTCTATITVEDNINPTAVCQNLTIQLDGTGGASITANDVDNGSFDNCSIASRTLSQTDFDCTEVGANVVTLTVTDVNGNSSTCNATITVEDNISPVAACQNLTVQLDASGAAIITPAQVDNGSSDNCGNVSLSLDNSSFGCSDVGANTVVLTVTDDNGNSTTCTATITVEDNVSPTASCQDLTVQLDASGAGSITAAQVNNGSSDACGIASMTLSQTDFDCTDIGTNSVTLTVTDNNGNVSTCSATITVEDNMSPTALCQDLTVQLDANGQGSITAEQVDNGSSDNCNITLSLSQTDFTCSDVGTHSVTLTVTDDGNNVSTCTATITVEDNISPTAICQNLTIQLDASGTASITAGQVNNGSFDNCGIASTTLSQTNFNCAHVGANTVTMTVTDDNGNVSTCTSTVTVQDNINPTAICQNLTVQLDANGSASITAAQVDNGSFDNCGIASSSLSQTDFTCADVGTHSVTLTVTDNNGNTSTCNSTITVEDNTNPTAICQNLTVQLDASYAGSITAAQVDNGSFDNCSIASITVSQTDFDCTHVGSNTVTLTVTDVNGNVSTCTSTITVNDPDYDSDLIGDCTDPDIDGDGALNENDSDDYDEFVCSDTDGDGCEDCQSGTYDPANDGPDTDGDGICDDTDLCSDPLANNWDASLYANEECEPCPDAPVFDGIDIESFATTMSSADGDIALNISSGNADTLFLFGQNGTADLTITLPSDLDNIPAGYYTAIVMDSDGCIGVATLSPGGTTLQQPGISRTLIVPYALCCSGCGINDTDSDGICDDDDNCTDQTAPNYNDPANDPCVD